MKNMIGKYKAKLKLNKKKVLLLGSLFVIKKIILLAFMMGIGSSIFGAESGIKLEFDPDTATLNDTVIMNISIQNMSLQGEARVEGLENFTIVNQSSQRELSIVNFAKTETLKYIYILLPKKAGTFQMKVTAVSGGKKVESNTATVTIESGKPQSSAAKRDIGELYLETILPKESVYIGEKFVSGYQLFSVYQLSGKGFLDLPKYNGFISKEVDKEEFASRITKINGRDYLKEEVFKTVLTPVTTGEMTIPKLRYQVNVVEDDGFFGTSRPMFLNTIPRKINIKPLPEAGKPQNFQGIVGTLKLEREVGAAKVKAGETITMKLVLSGECSLDKMEKPYPPVIPGFKIYQTEKSSKTIVEGWKHKDIKEYEIIFVPESSGKYDIPDIDIWYFNTESAKYDKVTVQGFTAEVGNTKEGNEVGSPLQNQPQDSVKSGGSEIIEVMGSPDTDADKEYYSIKIKKSHVETSAVILMIGVFITAGILFIKRMKGYKPDPVLDELYNRLGKTNDESGIYDITAQMIKHKTGVSIKTVTMADIKEQKWNETLKENILKMVDYFENGRYFFAGTFDMNKAAKEIYRNIKEL